ncbi:hypothetical protein, partial [Salmonella sp. s59311]|uniref:hypothetical protein n=1 Tax=Salmonella sp. s59311 TaxID=3159715 RepID=UPI00397FD40A
TKRENDKLASMIQTINNFSADVATILISETIQPAFQKQWAGTGSQAQAKIVGVTSTLDIIFKIQEQQGEGGLNLYIFAAPATASYYAQQTSP